MATGCLFDLDGTLIDYEGASAVALNEPLKNFGGRVDQSLHSRILGTRNLDWASVILKENGIDDKMFGPQQYVDKYLESLEKLYDTLELMPHTTTLLTTLKEHKVPMAIATSSNRSSCIRKLNLHPSVFSHFLLEDSQGPLTVCGNDPEVKNGKPAPDIFIEAARRLSLPPSRCIVFEDSPSGVKAGAAAGCKVVAIPDMRYQNTDCWETVRDKYLQCGATWVVPSLKDVDIQEWIVGTD